MTQPDYNLDQHQIIVPPGEIALETKDVNVFYGKKQATFDTSLAFPRFKISALIGASGSGKSTFLRCLNRMNDDVATVTGAIMYRNVNINQKNLNVYVLRKNIGMVFQHPNPFAKTIRENIQFALKKHGVKDQTVLDQRVEQSLRAAALWDEVKDKLDTSALELSGGQAQRLCIARSIAMQPDILLLDEPASALDPISTAKIEETLLELKQKYTIIIVTHNMQQAARVSDYTAFFHLGHVMEYKKTADIFTRPQVKATEDYISGNFG
ncbi:phosphate ABC transporter ATP-binding protein PstB [Fructilactobacillus fructivorans]|uniref:Phosphate transport ATP-binding protein PstB n=1 Tax=Fructilactobacillus fructivorans TaxID=1614 RepID=A0A0C1PZK3_9LACO|nr:phosphate ABC transporter ATP-binding protein PstB [Fructilactobacillus fructivorans]KID41103.1 Phosphate transport ATP-binding protein PstB [Fructilactobacillus fructivorans]MCT0151473.1 phosphate ABC transporter ATP-binding protein [Fructilactobacillus fructivorans]MCT2866992.1 phosphate ABC transporter ATP-binding protein [Fructilactobacillus fructivorans]MCT2869293.1 phosphate ABC transporter ATP-binding protein [Fructilactobacillus fructivorans]MCT2873670.1 phosphate ABC transporter AT